MLPSSGPRTCASRPGGEGPGAATTAVTLKLRLRAPNAGKRRTLETGLRVFQEAARWYLELIQSSATTSRNVLHARYSEACARFPELQPATLQLAQSAAAAAQRSYETARAAGRRASPPVFADSLPFGLRRDYFRLVCRPQGGWVLLAPLLRGQGRLALPLQTSPYHEARLRQLQNAECRQGPLQLWRDAQGSWWVAVTLLFPRPEPADTSFLGVDRGLAKIAVTSSARFFSGRSIRWRQARWAERKSELQRTGRRSRLRRTRGRECRWLRSVLHVVSRRIVDEARVWGKGIALEALTGIRERIRGHRRQNRELHLGWAFRVLAAQLEYKAQLSGVAVQAVDPRNTSRTCSRCGFTAAENRRSQGWFHCRGCRFQLDSDLNAARNIAARADLAGGA